MQPMYYIGLDVHKRKISYCVKDGNGQIHAEGSISATRLDLSAKRTPLGAGAILFGTASWFAQQRAGASMPSAPWDSK
jgi:hypothetical protein